MKFRRFTFVIFIGGIILCSIIGIYVFSKRLWDSIQGAKRHWKEDKKFWIIAIIFDLFMVLFYIALIILSIIGFKKAWPRMH